MPFVWRGIDGTHLTAAALVADSGFVHTHASATQGGQLDWDDVWSDAVHSHQSDAEGGALDGAAITTTITGTGNVVKATSPTVSNQTDTGNLTVLGVVTSGQSGAGGGGNLRLVDDGGTTRWLAGIAGTAGARDYVVMHDPLGAGGNRITVSQSTGIVAVGTGLTVTAGDLTMGAAASQLVPGATSFSIRNNADSADNLLVSDAGVVTIRAGATVTSGNVTVTSGNVTVSAGNVTLTAGDLTLSNGVARVDAAASTTYALTTRAVGDANPRFKARADGLLVWSDAAGSNDVDLYRSAADVLKTDDSLVVVGAANVGGDLTMSAALDHNGSTVGFYGTAPGAKPTVTGSRGANAALASLLTALAGLGLITDSSSA